MHFLIALFVGALSAFAFEPFGWWPLMLVALAALCELVARAGSLKRALIIGWLGGVIVATNRWVRRSAPPGPVS